MAEYRLRPCPFCGCEMEVVATAKLTDADITSAAFRGWSADGDHAEGCPLEDEVIALRFKPDECAECWNMRAPLAD